jgi:hypothetical protein
LREIDVPRLAAATLGVHHDLSLLDLTFESRNPAVGVVQPECCVGCMHVARVESSADYFLDAVGSVDYNHTVCSVD